MAESLWNAAEEYLATQLLSGMGPASSYADLKLTTVKRWAQFDVANFKNCVLPFGIIMSFDGRAQAAGVDGSATIKRVNGYTAAIICVTDGTREQATIDAKTLEWRTANLLSTLRFGTVTADDGSKMSKVISAGEGQMFRSNISLWDKPTTNADLVYGLSAVYFTLIGNTA